MSNTQAMPRMYQASQMLDAGRQSKEMEMTMRAENICTPASRNRKRRPR